MTDHNNQSSDAGKQDVDMDSANQVASNYGCGQIPGIAIPQQGSRAQGDWPTVQRSQWYSPYLSAVPAQKDVSSVPPGYPTHGGGFLPSQADFQQLLDQVDASQQPLRWGPPFIMGPSGGIDVYQAHFEHLNRQLERNRGSNRRTVQQQELATTEQQQIQQQPQKHAEPYIPKFLNSMDAFSGHLLSPGWRPPAGTYGMPMRNEREVDDQGMIHISPTFMRGGVWMQDPDDVEAACHVIVGQVAMMHVFGVTSIMSKRLPEQVPPQHDQNHRLTFAQRVWLLSILVKHYKHHADELIRMRMVEEYAMWALSKLRDCGYFGLFNGHPEEFMKRFDALGVPKIQTRGPGPVGKGRPQPTGDTRDSRLSATSAQDAGGDDCSLYRNPPSCSPMLAPAFTTSNRLHGIGSARTTQPFDGAAQAARAEVSAASLPSGDSAHNYNTEHGQGVDFIDQLLKERGLNVSKSLHMPESFRNSFGSLNAPRGMTADHTRVETGQPSLPGRYGTPSVHAGANTGNHSTGLPQAGRKQSSSTRPGSSQTAASERNLHMG